MHRRIVFCASLCLALSCHQRIALRLHMSLLYWIPLVSRGRSAMEIQTLRK